MLLAVVVPRISSRPFGPCKMPFQEASKPLKFRAGKAQERLKASP